MRLVTITTPFLEITLLLCLLEHKSIIIIIIIIIIEDIVILEMFEIPFWIWEPRKTAGMESLYMGTQ